MQCNATRATLKQVTGLNKERMKEAIDRCIYTTIEVIINNTWPFYFYIYYYRQVSKPLINMSEQHQNQNVETVGMGVQFPTPIKAPHERVWAVMVDKVYNTEKYLPVTNVKTTDIIPGKHVYREMLLNGRPKNENIYLDESHYEIRFDVVDEDSIHVNKYYPDTGILEYWQENGKGQRIPWNVPKTIVLEAMKKTKEAAEASK
jgi:hypothetical protein